MELLISANLDNKCIINLGYIFKILVCIIKSLYKCLITHYTIIFITDQLFLLATPYQSRAFVFSYALNLIHVSLIIENVATLL